MDRTVLLGMVALAGIALSGCKPPETPTVSPSDYGPASAEELEMDYKSAVEFGIGDVDAHMAIEAELARRSQSRRISNIRHTTERDDLASVTVEVRPPYPDSLFIVVTGLSRDNFDGHAVQVLTTIKADDETIGELNFVFGNDARRDPHSVEIDIMPFLDPVPETVLVHAEAKITLFKNTDQATIGIDTPAGPENYSIIKYSNPLRINFAK